MNCAQVKEQLVDFLYEELPPNLRAAFVEHLHACPGCSAEVASHQKALGQARAALAGPLLQEPPARVHAAVLAAAQAAASATKRDQPGFLARFWRTPWLLPAFGAVSVATAVFLVKVLKNPEVLPGQKPRPVDELAAPAAARPTVAPVPAEQAKVAPGLAAEGGEPEPLPEPIGRTQPVGGRRAKALATRAAGKAEAPPRAGAGAPASGASTRFAESPPPRPAAKASRDIDDMLGSVGRRPAPVPVTGEAARPAAEKKSRADRDEDTLLLDRAPGAPAAEAEHPAPPRGYAAAPPPPVVTSAPKPQSAEARVPAPAAAPPSPSRAIKGKRAVLAAEEAPSAGLDDGDYDAKERAAPAKQAGPSLDEGIRKAERLFAAQNWTAAAEAYRDLLRRFPSHKDAPKWRDRIGQSLVAEQERRRVNEAEAAKAAKASGDTQILKDDR